LKKKLSITILTKHHKSLQRFFEEYIGFSNSQRPHRKLNMKTPIQYEAEFFLLLANKRMVSIFEFRVKEFKMETHTKTIRSFQISIFAGPLILPKSLCIFFAPQA